MLIFLLRKTGIKSTGLSEKLLTFFGARSCMSGRNKSVVLAKYVTAGSTKSVWKNMQIKSYIRSRYNVAAQVNSVFNFSGFPLHYQTVILGLPDCDSRRIWKLLTNEQPLKTHHTSSHPTRIKVCTARFWVHKVNRFWIKFVPVRAVQERTNILKFSFHESCWYVSVLKLQKQ